MKTYEYPQCMFLLWNRKLLCKYPLICSYGYGNMNTSEKKWEDTVFTQNCLEGQAWAQMVGSDQMLQIVASHQCLHCLPLIEQLLDTSVGSKIDLLKFYNRCGKEILGKCGIIAYQQYNTPKWASARQNLQ